MWFLSRHLFKWKLSSCYLHSKHFTSPPKLEAQYAGKIARTSRTEVWVSYLFKRPSLSRINFWRGVVICRSWACMASHCILPRLCNLLRQVSGTVLPFFFSRSFEVYVPPDLLQIGMVITHKKSITTLVWHHGYGDLTTAANTAGTLWTSSVCCAVSRPFCRLGHAFRIHFSQFPFVFPVSRVRAVSSSWYWKTQHRTSHIALHASLFTHRTSHIVLYTSHFTPRTRLSLVSHFTWTARTSRYSHSCLIHCFFASYCALVSCTLDGCETNTKHDSRVQSVRTRNLSGKYENEPLCSVLFRESAFD